MTTILETGKAFFEACDTGKGWEVCQTWCTPGATFTAQAAALADLTTVQQYTEWMKNLLTVLKDGRYELKFIGAGDDHGLVCAFATFIGTHLAGGPVPPTGRTTRTDYVYAMEFQDGAIVHLTKIWNDGHALKELGWA